MRRLKLLFVVMTIAATTLACEMFVGRRSFRAEQDRMLADAAQLLGQVPEVVGDWKKLSETQLPPNVVTTLECRGQLCRQYKNESTGKIVSVVLLVGPPGPLVAHTPEVCMGGQGFRRLTGPDRVEFGTDRRTPQALLRSTFAVTNSPQKLAVYYGWARGSRYEAPKFPRFELGREPMLFKIQVQVVLDTSRRAGDQPDAGHKFIADFLPVINECLSTPAKSPAAEPGVRTTAGPSWLKRVTERFVW